MAARVSTYAVTGNLFGQMQRLQVGYADASRQSSSGLKAETFDGIAPDAQRMLALDAEQKSLTGQALALQSATVKIGALQNIMSSISDTLNKVSSLLVSAQNGLDITSSAPANAAQAQVLLNSLVGLLNSQIGGSYMFGGNIQNRPPVDLTDPSYTPTAAPTTPNTGYYQGDAAIDSVRASDSMRIDYGILASNPAFEQALRALSLYIANPTSATVMAQAYDLNKAAINGAAGIQGHLLARSNAVAAAKDLNEATSAYLVDSISTIRDADVAAAATQMTQIETQLQASFSSLAKLLQLRLTDYLR